MPSELLNAKRINLDLLYPPFLEKVINVLARCRARGADYYIISGTRTWDEQQELYNQGRTKPGKIVTNARPGYSFHNFGLAVDCARDKDLDRKGLQPDWNLESYRILAEEVKEEGLDSGFYWKFKDAPHIQPVFPKGILRTFRELYAKGGYKAVWENLK